MIWYLFTRIFGVGKLGLHKAFRIGHDENGKVEIQPITRIAHVKIDDLVGYEIAKKNSSKHRGLCAGKKGKQLSALW